jgi:uncharacterized repeat protein (TIGR02543 family)
MKNFKNRAIAFLLAFAMVATTMFSDVSMISADDGAVTTNASTNEATLGTTGDAGTTVTGEVTTNDTGTAATTGTDNAATAGTDNAATAGTDNAATAVTGDAGTAVTDDAGTAVTDDAGTAVTGGEEGTVTDGAITVMGAETPTTEDTPAEVVYHTVNFLNDDQTTFVEPPQQVAEGSYAVQPASPSKDGYAFVGWYLSTDTTKTPVDLTQYAITSDTTFIALYKVNGTNTITISYLFSDGSAAAAPYVATVETGSSFNKEVSSPTIPGFTADQTSVKLSYNNISSDQTVEVHYTGALTTYTVNYEQQDLNNENNYTTVDSETKTSQVGLLTDATAKDYPGFTAQPFENVSVESNGATVIEIKYTRNYYTLTFNSNGGSSVETQRLKYGATITAGNPTKLGYTFTGWSNLPTPATMPAADLELSANWQENTSADYTVVYWQQKTTGGSTASDYDYYETATKTGTVGQTATYDEKSYDGFEFSHADEITITSDGKTVENVYYNRKTYTINLYTLQNRKWTTYKTISALYGADIINEWNDASTDYDWCTTKNGSTFYTLVFTMPINGFDAYGKTKSGNQTITYYVQNLSGTGYDVYSSLSGQGFSSLTTEDQMPIEGFTYSTWTQPPITGGNRWNGYKYGDAALYYTRNSYTIDYFNCSGVNSQSFKYKASISGGNVTSNIGKPAGVDDDYIFAGWYLDPGFTEKVNWSSTMPSHNMSVYAKWTAPTYTVSFDTNGADSATPETITVTKYETIENSMPDDPTKTNDTFLGWYIDSMLTKPFVKTNQITGNITLYAKWQSTSMGSYRIVCKDGSDNSDIQVGEYISVPIGTAVSLNPPTVQGYHANNGNKTVVITQLNQDITFYYTKDNTWTYQVSYVDATTNNEISGYPVETFPTSNASVTIFAKSISGYQLVSSNSVVATAENKNVVFTYRSNNANVTVYYYKDDVKDNAATITNSAMIGSSYTAPAAEDKYDGYYLSTTGSALRKNVTAEGITIDVYYCSKQNIILTGKKDSKQYNGTEQTLTGYTSSVSGLTFTGVSASGKGTNVGSYPVVVTIDNDNFTIKDGSKDVTNHFNAPTCVNGTLTITAKPVKVTAENKSKIYGADDPELTATVAGTLGTDTVTYTLSRAQGENVGTYAITPTGEAVQGNYAVTYVAGSLEITKGAAKDNAVTATPYKDVYDANAHTITASAEQDSSTLYYSTDNATWSTTAPTWTDVTEAQTVYVKATNPNYEDSFGSATVTITAKPVKVTAENKSKIYGADDPELTATVAGTLGTDTVTYTLSRAQGENVGTYAITPAGEAVQGNYAVTYVAGSLEITKASKNGVNAISYNDVYDANAHTITASATQTGSTLYYSTVAPEKATPDDWNNTAPTWTDVTTVQRVYVKATNPNYEDSFGSATVTITAKPVKVTAENKSKIYGADDPELTATVAGTLGTDTVTYTLSRAQGENVGTYAITPTGEAVQGNYAVTYVAGSLEITKGAAKDNAVTATPYKDVYDANAHTITASAEQDSSTLYYSTDNATWSTTAPTWTDVTEAQTVYVKATNPNYEDSFGSATVTITAKPVKVTAENKSKIYGADDPELTATVAGTLGTDTVTYTLSRAQGENVGTYAITPTGEAVQGNYAVTYVAGSLEITKGAAKDNAVTATPYKDVYDANAHTITASAEQDSSTLYYSTDNATWSTTAPTWTDVTEAQTVYVKATNPNYEDSFGSATVTITAKPVKVTAENKSKIYGADDPELTATVAGTLGTDTVTYTLSRAQGENVGTLCDHTDRRSSTGQLRCNLCGRLAGDHEGRGKRQRSNSNTLQGRL